ncbi:transcriptional regulator TrmB [Halobacillus karajensis]|uniref:Transcriptional regulator n=1 Tax=Halobacillus karajensis TaxID=195088 RepID=A0A059NW70_9BACI|nr:TrmB family transcriptional regulator [Halobacillus karajensis]CDQ19309.1 putative transcriptional regulator [Halobacillus karajensis]CDQ22528.1 putative transcriptional regulator [Halobacillus karajensis]CDQ26010.1 putative transcriptional regulator [Halobacillus karajensis]SEH38512.1 transcriptional regulator TrmB [Halobacillus karajensis]
MLQKFGFTQYESQVFEALTASSEPMDATSIVKYSQVPKSKVYEVLQRLVEKGLILTSFQERKKLYTALSLETTIEKLTAEFQANVDEIRNTTYKLHDSDERVWTIQNEKSIKALASECIQKAKREILLTGWSDELQHFLPLLEEKKKEGVKVELLSVGDLEPGSLHAHVLLPDERHDALERHKLIIIDHKEILFAGVERSDFQGIHTLSKPLVKFFTEFFYHDVALTVITKKYQDVLMADEEIKETLMKLRY